MAEVVRDEIKKAFETVSTPMPETDTQSTPDAGEEIRKGIRAILEGKSNITEVKKMFIGGA